MSHPVNEDDEDISTDDDDDDEDDEDDEAPEETREETPDLYRNSSLGMYVTPHFVNLSELTHLPIGTQE